MTDPFAPALTALRAKREALMRDVAAIDIALTCLETMPAGGGSAPLALPAPRKRTKKASAKSRAGAPPQSGGWGRIDKVELARRWNAGEATAAIAQALGCSPPGVISTAKRLNLTPRPRGWRPPSPPAAVSAGPQ